MVLLHLPALAGLGFFRELVVKMLLQKEFRQYMVGMCVELDQVTWFIAMARLVVIRMVGIGRCSLKRTYDFMYMPPFIIALCVLMVLTSCSPEPTGGVYLPVGMPLETKKDLENIFLAVKLEKPGRWRLGEEYKAPFLTYVAQACSLAELEHMRDLKIDEDAEVWLILKENFPESRAFFEDPNIVREGYVMPAELVKGMITLIGKAR